MWPLEAGSRVGGRIQQHSPLRKEASEDRPSREHNLRVLWREAAAGCGRGAGKRCGLWKGPLAGGECVPAVSGPEHQVRYWRCPTTQWPMPFMTLQHHFTYFFNSTQVLWELESIFFLALCENKLACLKESLSTSKYTSSTSAWEQAGEAKWTESHLFIKFALIFSHYGYLSVTMVARWCATTDNTGRSLVSRALAFTVQTFIWTGGNLTWDIT